MVQHFAVRNFNTRSLKAARGPNNEERQAQAAAELAEVQGWLAQEPACDNEPAATPPTAAATNNAGFMDRMLRQTGFELMPMNDI